MSKLNYIKFFELANQAMMVVDMDGYILSINKLLCDLLGYTENELINTKFWDYLFEKDKEITIQESEIVKSGMSSKSFVNRYLRKDNKIVYLEWSSYPDLENQITYAIGRDITKLLFNDSLLQEVAHSIPGTIFKIIKNNNGTYEFAFANQKLIGLFQQNSDKDTFNTFLEKLSLESEMIFLKELENAERDMKFKSFNIFLKSEINTVYQINLNPFKEDRSVVFYGVSTKLSENYIQKPLSKERLKNQILDKNQGFFSLILNDFKINDTFEANLNSYMNATIAECNEVFAQIYGFNKEQIIDKTIKDLNSNIDDIRAFVKKLLNNNFNLINNISFDEKSDIYYNTNISCVIENGYLKQLIACFEDITSQLLKQKYLNQSESNYKQIFENSPIGIMIHDENKVLKINNIALQLLETTQEEILGTNPLNLVEKDYYHQIKERFDNIFVKKNKFNNPKHIKLNTLKGNVIDVQVAGHSIIYNNKTCLEVTFVDITNNVKLQNENEKLKNLFESVLNNTSEYILRIDKNGIFTYCNKSYKDKIGYDIVNKPLTYCVPEDQIILVDEIIKKIKKNPTKKYKLVIRKKDINGKEFFVDWEFVSILENNIICIQCIGKDVTEINKTKKELELANLRYKESAKLARLAYWEYIIDTNEVIWNDNLYEILGYSKDKEISYEFSRSLIHIDDLNEFDRVFNKATSFFEIVYYEYRFKKSNGEYIHVNGNMKPIFDTNNNIEKIVASLQDITEFKQKEKEIIYNKNIYEAIFKSLPIGLNLQDKNNKIIMHNKEATKILGLTENQLLGLDSFDPKWKAENEYGELLKAEDYPSVKTINTGESVRNFVMKVSKGENDFTWILVNTEPVSFLQNKVESLIVSFMDITQLKELNNKISSSLLLLNEMGSLAKTGAWEYDVDKDELFWSDSMYEIYELDKSYIPKNEVEKRFYPSYQIEKVIKDFDDLTENKKELDAQYDFIDARGNEKVIRFKAKFVDSFNNKTNKIIGITQDITYLIKKDKEIANKNISLQQLKNAIDKSSIVSYTDAKGRLIEVNKKFTEVYGYAEDEILNRKHNLLNSGYHSKEFWKSFWEIILKGNIWTGEICNKTKSGKLLWFYATIIPLKDSTGKILNFLEILIDISLSKKYEKELEETVNSRTKELNETLVEKDFILQMVSHDLKNPLTGIVLQTELLKIITKKNNFEGIEDKVNYILDCTNRMNLIIKNLLEFDSIHKNQDLLLNKVNINDLINELKSSYKERLKKKNQLLLIEGIENNLLVRSNKNHLYQIIENLISNASKFSKTNTKIELKIERIDENVIIKIKDEGPGIPENEISKIFDKFVKLSNKPTGNEVSSGLGLAIVKKLCNLLDHEITVHSILNIGTIFTIKLKCLK